MPDRGDEHAADDDVLDGESTRSRTMPDRSDCMTTAPRMAPGIVPMPPENEVPPMTAAAITSSSFWTPRLVTAALRRAVWIGGADRAQDAHQHERRHDRPADVDAAQLGRLGVAADGEHVAAEAAARRDERHDQRHGDRRSAPG